MRLGRGREWAVKKDKIEAKDETDRFSVYL
jgi:hypothetical protein